MFKPWNGVDSGHLQTVSRDDSEITWKIRRKMAQAIRVPSTRIDLFLTHRIYPEKVRKLRRNLLLW